MNVSSTHEDEPADANMGFGKMGLAAVKQALPLLLLTDSSAQTGNGGG